MSAASVCHGARARYLLDLVLSRIYALQIEHDNLLSSSPLSSPDIELIVSRDSRYEARGPEPVQRHQRIIQLLHVS